MASGVRMRSTVKASTLGLMETDTKAVIGTVKGKVLGP